MGRRLKNRILLILEACKVLEHHGWMTAREIYCSIPEDIRCDATPYGLSRALVYRAWRFVEARSISNENSHKCFRLREMPTSGSLKYWMGCTYSPVPDSVSRLAW